MVWMIWFEDKRGRILTLTNERIKHIGFHMSLHDKHHLIEEILKSPDIFSQDEEQPETAHYQGYLRQENIYLIIVAKLFNGEGFIITIYKSKKPKVIQ